MDAEKILQFISVTSSEEEVARRYLDASAGDLDMAIGMYLESNDDRSATNDVTSSTSISPISPTSYKEKCVKCV